MTAFAAWCADTGPQAMPADAATFAEDTSHLCDRDLAASTVQRAQAAIRKLHEDSGHPDMPPAKLARDVLLGYRRMRAEAGRSG